MEDVEIVSMTLDGMSFTEDECMDATSGVETGTATLVMTVERAEEDVTRQEPASYLSLG